MTVKDHSAVQGERAPTEAEPEIGRAALAIGDQHLVFSEAARWVEPDGDHVLQSLEFDVIGGGGTLEEALAKFIDNIYEFAEYLAELKDPAENEEEMFHLLASRLLRVSREQERLLESQRKAPWISLNLQRRRRSREDVREWHPSSRQRGSRQPSHA